MPPEILKAHLLTRGAYYRGALRYADAPGTARPRLLDFLNARARGRGAAEHRVSVIHLDHADVTIYRGSTKLVQQVELLTVSVQAVVVAFDESPPRPTTVPPPPTYETRMAMDKQPVAVLTRTRHQLRGIVRGGVKRLGIRTADEQFIALTDVTIEDLSAEDRPPATLPFVALNMEFVETFWSP